MSTRITYLLLIFLGFQGFIRGQDANLAPKDMEFTRGVIQRFHLAAWVSLQIDANKYVRYQYDRYPQSDAKPGVERIISAEGTFVHKFGGVWVKSDNWGETGSSVSSDLDAELKTYAMVVNAQFAIPTDHDSTQGKPVWKFIQQTSDSLFTYYCYERSREHPHANGVYPQLTFMKAASDVDGRLFLRMSTGQMISGEQHIPFTVRFIYLVPIPAGAKVQVRDKDTGKLKIDTVASADSGWETTAYASDPVNAAFGGKSKFDAKVGDIGPDAKPSTNAASQVSPQ